MEVLAGIIAKADDNPDEWRGVKTIIDSACGQTGACDKNKTWVVDVDTKDDDELETIKNVINQCEPFDTKKVVAVIPTLHGYHIISKPFKKMKFSQLYGKQIDIHNNNPTLLYTETKD